MGMVRFVIRRLMIIPPLLLTLTFFLFLLLNLAPGDPARMLAGPKADENQVELTRKAYGLDQPFYIQYSRWLIGWPGPDPQYLEDISENFREYYLGNIPKGILWGDFGRSWKHGSISQVIMERLPVTLGLTVLALLIAIGMGLLLGIIAALKRGTIVDYLSTSGALFGLSMPSFWLGLMAILVFSIHLGWFPLRYDLERPFISMFMPATILGAYHTASVARMTRSSMLEVLGQDYIRTAKVKGLAERVVVLKHGLKNALIPIVTILVLQIPWLFGGAVVLEKVFTIPGMGSLMIESIFPHSDPYVVLDLFLVFAVLTVFANLLGDILYAYINPKIRYE
jgi:ABC-type dipeptide/oligopeptide/nickel transport system permease component